MAGIALSVGLLTNLGNAPLSAQPIMKISSTVHPSDPKLAQSVMRADVMRLASTLAAEGGLDRSAALKDAWQCFHEWRVAREREEAEKRARYHRSFKRRRKATVIGARVTDRTGGAFDGEVIEMESRKARELVRIRREIAA